MLEGLIRSVDDALFDWLFQPLSNLFQRYTHRTCFMLSALCYTGFLLFLTAGTLIDGFQNAGSISLSDVGLSIVIWVVFGPQVKDLIDRDIQWLKKDNQRVNPLRASEHSLALRTVILFLTLFFILLFALSSWISDMASGGILCFPFLCFFSHLYFFSCTPWPRQQQCDTVAETT